MTAEFALLIAIIVFLLLVAIETPVGLAMAIGGTLGIALIGSVDLALTVLSTAPFDSTARYALFVIPMYVLLGALVSNTNIGTEIYSSVNRLVGRFRGGLAATCVLATAIFSGISGSSAADVAVFGKISVTEMARHGYDKRHAAAIVAAAGTFAALIPPSVALVVYGIIANVSIGALILAGVVPGAISALILSGYLIVRPGVRTEPADAARVTKRAKQLIVGDGVLMPNRLGGGVSGLIYAGILFGIVVGGLYGGVFTPTEAGAAGAAAALLIAVFNPTSKARGIASILRLAVRETAQLTSMIFLLLLGGAVFTFFIVYGGVAARISEWASALPLPPTVLVAIILVFLIPMGMFLDGLSILLIVVPIAAPIVTSLGFDGVWFGIMVVKMVEIGLITPPVGINVYIIAGIAELPVEAVFRQIGPFIVLDLAVTVLLFAVPALTTWLPTLAGLN